MELRLLGLAALEVGLKLQDELATLVDLGLQVAFVSEDSQLGTSDHLDEAVAKLKAELFAYLLLGLTEALVGLEAGTNRLNQVSL